MVVTHHQAQGRSIAACVPCPSQRREGSCDPTLPCGSTPDHRQKESAGMGEPATARRLSDHLRVQRLRSTRGDHMSAPWGQCPKLCVHTLHCRVRAGV
jgi:hypothetical protein